MDARGPAGGMPRRAFLAATLGGLAVTLAACTDGGPTPTPTPTRTPAPSPTPSAGGVPAPEAFLRSRWSRDPFTRGAFSFEAVGSTPELRRALAEPIADRLVIAGEGTSSDAPGTVHGAYAEGVRAARTIADLADEGDRIAVIGAGIAGLAAARTLADAGHDVVVVEAGTSLGGRLRTVEDDAFGGPVVLGSVFASDGAELRPVLAEAGVATRPFTPNVQARTPDGVVAEPSPAGWEAIAIAQEWAAGNSADVSLTNALIRSGAVPISGEPGADGLSPRDWLVNAISTGVEPTTGAAPTRVSAKRFDADMVWRPTSRVVSGWSALIDRLADGLAIAGSSVVTTITVGDDGVGLRLDTGESLRMHRVIVTASVGVLKTDTITFDPPLPLLHQRAIGVLGMGASDVVWLAFDEPFWRADAAGATPTDGTSGDANVFTLVGATPTVAAWLDVGVDPRRPVLLGILAAEHARRLAELDDDDALAEVLASLEPFAPR
ncbi:flavin monoamine oxidase family protein [Agromyces bracchium]|uniref:NAD(P)-binding protein n=1 Tax=Agromyces bracchium TaxID=88376 RepID=A0A6I3M505_9MICO|nr:FAD-dependent oxidoreductase [Agromyces bracchium]MTH67217.1 NAD(P)-binding protein [Agromyces bracchium]